MLRIPFIYTITLVTFSIALFSFAPQSALAQKFAYIDSDYVLLHMPDYASAQQELNSFAIEWQAEIETKKKIYRWVSVKGLTKIGIPRPTENLMKKYAF